MSFEKQIIGNWKYELNDRIRILNFSEDGVYRQYQLPKTTLQELGALVGTECTYGTWWIKGSKLYTRMNTTENDHLGSLIGTLIIKIGTAIEGPTEREFSSISDDKIYWKKSHSWTRVYDKNPE